MACLVCNEETIKVFESDLPCAKCGFQDSSIYAANIKDGRVFIRINKGGKWSWEEAEKLFRSKVDGVVYDPQRK